MSRRSTAATYPDRFAGSIAIVTGGGSGIGEATVLQLAEQGADRIYVCDIHAENASAVAARLPVATAAHVDVAESSSVDSLFTEVLAQHGRVDVVVHSAGVDDPEAKRAMYQAQHDGVPVSVTDDLTDERWNRMLTINLDGTFFVLRAAIRAMKPARSGSIVAVGSLAGFDTMAGYPHYSAAKAGVHALVQSLAKEVLPFGVRVNAVAPGPTETPMAARTDTSLRRAVVGSTASADELADNILYLASRSASNIVGEIVLSNGGRSTF